MRRASALTTYGALLQIVLFDFSVECSFADAEDFRCFLYVLHFLRGSEQARAKQSETLRLIHCSSSAQPSNESCADTAKNKSAGSRDHPSAKRHIRIPGVSKRIIYFPPSAGRPLPKSSTWVWIAIPLNSQCIGSGSQRSIARKDKPILYSSRESNRLRRKVNRLPTHLKMRNSNW